MSIVSLSFAATLPTYNSVGSNGTVFQNNTLPTSGNVLVNTNDSSSGLPSVLLSNLSANGLNYASESYSISGNTLSVIYGLSSGATDAQQIQADDQSAAISGGYPGNATEFVSSGSLNEGGTDATAYAATTTGVLGKVPPDQGSAEGLSTGSGASLSIQSIAAGAGNTLDVVYVLNPTSSGITNATAAAAASPHRGAGAPSSLQGNSSSIVSVLAGLPSSATSNAALGAKGDTNNTLSPGALLASLLNANLNQQLNAYNVVTDFSNSSSNNTFNLLA